MLTTVQNISWIWNDAVQLFKKMAELVWTYPARLCKLRNGVKKTPNFFYFQWKKVDQVRSEYLRSYLNWLHNWELKSRRRSHALKGSHSMGDGRIFLKTGGDASFNKDLSNEPISTGSISLDSTFNVILL